jgi:c-di-AMP phosphodiesterase-like protein
MFGWLEKIIIKRIIKRVQKELPALQAMALDAFKENKDELIEKAKEGIKNAVVDFIKSKTHK